MQTVVSGCVLFVLLSLAGCATVRPLALEEQIPDVSTMELVGDHLFGCANPYVPDLWKHSYEGKDVDVVLFGEVREQPGGDNHGPLLAVLFFEKETEKILKAVVRVRGELRMFPTLEALLAVYPTPCDILAANRVMSVTALPSYGETAMSHPYPRDYR